MVSARRQNKSPIGVFVASIGGGGDVGVVSKGRGTDSSMDPSSAHFDRLSRSPFLSLRLLCCCGESDLHLGAGLLIPSVRGPKPLTWPYYHGGVFRARGARLKRTRA